MDTAKLKKFAQTARRELMQQVRAKLTQVLAEDSLARREQPRSVEELEKQIHSHGKEEIIERAAYTWFNRLTALRFMDTHHYNRIMVISPAEGQTQPEILAEAKQGHIDEGIVPEPVRERVFGLLDGRVPSRDAQGEAYRLLVVAVCNYWHVAMPFLFQRITDWTELLMPDDLLSDNSVRTRIRSVLTAEDCEDVEVIGWLYQFYISEKKDEVFEGLKKNKKITPENIPAATQLFTPHWIVRYLVENSLGRLWLLNRPDSKLVEKMDYYIKPADSESGAETDFLRISKPEEIKICDPACGSGHMLTYAFDLLYAIYAEEGYEPAEIAEKILTKNLYGIEIDERAGELAAFALTMKARAKQRRFFNKGVKPNICVLENVHFDEGELKSYMNFVGRDLFTVPLQATLRQFEEADNFGSLIRPDVSDVDGMLRILESKNVSGQLFISMTHQKVLQALRQADYLSPKYHVVIANPPYMGSKGMNGRLGAWLKDNYADVKADLFSAFIVRNTELALLKGQLGFMSPFVWMFISSYEKLRSFLINKKTITSLVQLEYSGFDGATVPICTFTVENAHRPDFKGGYVRLSDFRGSENQGPRTLEAIKDPGCGWFYRASAANFKKIPGSPIAYWVGKNAISAYASGKRLGAFCYGQPGLQTSNNGLFLRVWYEVSDGEIGFNLESSELAAGSGRRWFPYLKGGDFRRWHGNQKYIVNWQNNGAEIKEYVTKKYPYLNGNIDYVVKDRGYYFKNGITYSKITSAIFNARFSDKGFLFDVAGSSIFPDERDAPLYLGFLNSIVCRNFLKAQNPTLNLQSGDIDNLPFSPEVIQNEKNRVTTAILRLKDLSRKDWNSYETSWDFADLPLLNPDYRQPTLSLIYQKLRAHWREMTLEMQRLEEENNRIFIEAYGLQDELTPEVPLNEITLTCNPHYRYGNGKSEHELEALLLADTMRELVSYAVGCMFGRYALDKPGLILANQGETIEDYLKRVPEPSFPADDDNVIPMLDGDWFTDDVAERFREFLRLAFGEEHYEENLQFVEQSLNIKSKRNYTIRNYFLGEFYADHVKRYKKRPIYWLFSSPKGSFNALIYMHRYRPDTVSMILSDYLREFRTKLAARVDQLEDIEASASSSARDKTAALKEMTKLRNLIAELEDWERKDLLPLASERIEIDLDDGVKVNYAKFGSVLARVPGLSA